MAFADNTTGGRTILQGICPCRIHLAGTVEVGDMLGYSSGWKQALATTPNQIIARLVAGQAGKSGDYIIAYPIAVIGGLTGMTQGGSIYSEESTLAGQITTTAPSTTGDVNAPIGISLTTTECLVYPGVFPAYADADHLA